MNHVPVTLKKPNAVRWLSLHQAVEAIWKSWPELIITLGQLAEDGNPSARGILQKTGKIKCVIQTALFMDILPHFTRLNKTYQRADLDLDRVTCMLDVTKDTLQTMLPEPDQPDNEKFVTMPLFCELLSKIREWNENPRMRAYRGIQVTVQAGLAQEAENTATLLLNELLCQLDRRFPQDQVDLLRYFDVVVLPKKVTNVDAHEVGGFGNHEFSFILEHFEQNLPGCLDTERAKVDYPCYKAYFRTMVQLATTGRVFSFSAFTKDTTTLYAEEFPDFCTLLEFLIVIPMTSATCERGFSAQNRIKTAKGNRLNEDRLKTILKVSINGPHWAEFDYTNAAENFRELKRRRFV